MIPETKDWFVLELRTALNGLYDPTVLRSNPLIDFFGLKSHRDPISALRRILLDGIESLRPRSGTPLGSKSWRVYQILRRRYTEQLVQRDVAADLNLSVRQMQREEKVARELLADSLWDRFHPDHPVDLQPAPPGANTIDMHADAADILAGEFEELEWMARNTPVQAIDLRDLIAEVFQTLKPALEKAEVEVELPAEEDLPALWVKVQILRQALINLIMAAGDQAPCGTVSIWIAIDKPRAEIKIESRYHGEDVPLLAADQTTNLEMADKLIRLCDGDLTLETQSPTEDLCFKAIIRISSVDRKTVLFIEDHSDSLQLYQRYLNDSRYRFVGAGNSADGFRLAVETRPAVIVMDLMMPEKDGWTLLAEMRVHPTLSQVPVLICSIIPQARLAQSLGAAGFLHKPITRDELLAALDQQTNQPEKGFG